MAQVPREAVEFARMVVRAFYPPEFIVVADAVLRNNNYCAHHDLARRLGMQAKELRQILVQMAHARVLQVEKRQQKRINFRDEKRPQRTVNTEFWYVPLVELLDSFTYRVHKISKEVEDRRQNEIAHQKWVCSDCKTEYDQIEILGNLNENKQFICDKMGVRLDRRPKPCGGIIKEEDNTAKIRETERIRQRLDEELRPLRTKAEQCSGLEIPAHPLEGADEKTWGELVPETVGVYGEAVDEDGLDMEMSAELNEKPQQIEPIRSSKPVVTPEPKDDGVIPDKPSWFKDSSRDADEGDDDWVNEQPQARLDSKTGTAASFAAEEDEKEYYARYLKEIGGEDVAQSQSQQQTNEVIQLDSPEEKPQEVETTSFQEAEEEDVTVRVAGKEMKLSEITEEMTEKMTAEEYRAYYALAQGGGGAGGDDDDDEFE